MNAAELMAALNTVEQDHRLVLDKVQALKEAVSCLLEPSITDMRCTLRRFWEINEFLSTQFTSHMEEEETSLFPFLEQYTPEGRDLVGRLRLEHEEIRRMREEFGNCLHVASELEPDLPKAVLRDLLADGWALWEIMDNHAHAETQGVRQCIARQLGEETPAGSG